MGIGGLAGKPSEPLWGGAISQSGIKLSLKTQKEQDNFFKHQHFLYFFGSLAQGKLMPWSDLDLAVLLDRF